MASVLRNAAFLAVAKSFSVAIYALLGLVLPQFVATDANGVYSLMTTLLFFGGMLATFGIPTVVTRAVARAPERSADVFAAGRTATLLGWALSVALLGGWLLFESIHAARTAAEAGHDIGWAVFDPLQWGLFAAVIVILLADALGGLGEAMFQGFERMAAPAAIEIGTGLVRAGGAVICMVALPEEQRLPAIFACFLLGSVGRAAMVARLMRRLPMGARTPGAGAPGAALKLVAESLYFAIFRGLRMIRNRVDLLLLGVLFVGTTAAEVADPDIARGVYGQAMRVIVVFHVLTQALLTAIWPRVARLTQEEGADSGNLVREFGRAMRWQAWWAAPLAAVLWIYADALAGFFGADYLNGVPEAGVGGTTGGVLRILLVVAFLDCASGPIGMVMMGLPKWERRLPALGGVLAGSSVVLNIILIPRYGILGAAYASLGAAIVEQLVRLVVIRSVFGSPKVMLGLLPYLLLTAAVVGGILALGLEEAPLLGVAAGGVFYLFASLGFGLIDPALLKVGRRLLRRG